MQYEDLLLAFRVGRPPAPRNEIAGDAVTRDEAEGEESRVVARTDGARGVRGLKRAARAARRARRAIE